MTVMAGDQLSYLTITEAAAGLRRGEFSPVDLTEACLRRIEVLDQKLHSFISVTADLARAQAGEAEQEIRSGKDRGPLHGIPIALKDLYMTKGIRTTCHSAVLENWIPDYEATTATKLREAGAILLGKLGMHEFAFGGPSIDAPFPCRAQSVEHRAYTRRLQQWVGCGAGSRAMLRRARIRHRWIYSNAGIALRYCRHQTHLRPCQPLRRYSAQLVARSRRPDGSQCRRLRSHAPSHLPAMIQEIRHRRMLRCQISGASLKDGIRACASACRAWVGSTRI